MAEYVQGEPASTAARLGGAAGAESGGSRSAEESVNDLDSQRPKQSDWTRAPRGEDNDWQTESEGDGDGEPEATEGAKLDYGNNPSPT